MYTEIKSFEDACKALNIGTELPDVSGWPEEMQSGKIAEYKLEIITKAVNEGWKPNWQDSNERKYTPWFWMAPEFSFHGVGNNDRYSSVGSRLCFQTYEKAEYVANQFLDLWKDHMNLN